MAYWKKGRHLEKEIELLDIFIETVERILRNWLPLRDVIGDIDAL